MNYTKADIKAVREAIAKEVPDAHFYEGDYGYTLRVANPAETHGWTLFETLCSHLDEHGSLPPQSEVVTAAFTRLEDGSRIVDLIRQRI